jgi:predicted Zn-dependent peptidase
MISIKDISNPQIVLDETSDKVVSITRPIVDKEFWNNALNTQPLSEILKINICRAPLICVKLVNGFTIYIHDRKMANCDTPLLSLRLLVNTVGNLSENLPDELGLAHFVEHSVFQGTKNFSREKIWNLLDRLGCKRAVDSNASTATDYTVFKFDNLSSESEDQVGECLELFYDFACQATFPRELILKEINVVEDELVSESNVNTESIKWHIENVYPNQQHLGHLCNSLIRNRDKDEIVDSAIEFYKREYQPHLMSLVVVGDFMNEEKREQFLRKAIEVYAKIPGVENAARRDSIKFEPSLPPKSSYLQFTHPEVQNTMITIWNRAAKDPVISNSIHSTDYLADSQLPNFGWYYDNLIKEIFANIFFYRFFPDKLNENSPVAVVKMSSEYYKPIQTSEYLLVTITVREEKIAQAYRRCLDELRRMTLYGVLDGEFQAAKDALLKRKITELQFFPKKDHVSFADWYVDHLTTFDSPHLIDAEIYYLAMKRFSEMIKKEDLTKVIALWNVSTPLQSNLMTTVVMGDKKQTAILNEMENHFKEVQTSTPEPSEDIDLSLSFLPTHLPKQAIVKTEKLNSIDPATHYGIEIDTLEFENGINVILAPTMEDPSSFIQMSLSIPYGRAHAMTQLHNHQELEPDRRAGYALLMGAGGLNMAGCGNKSFTSMRVIYTQNGISLFINVNYLNTVVTMTVNTQDNLETALKIFYTKLSTIQEIPLKAFENGFSSYLAYYKQQLRKGNNDDDDKFSDLYKKELYKNHKIFFPLEERDLTHMTAQEGLQAITNLFADFSQASFTICGKFQRNSVIDLLQRYVGNLKSTKSRISAPVQPFHFEGNHKENKLRIGHRKEAVFSSKTYSIGPWISGEIGYRNLVALDVLQQYLNQKIREEGQETYSISVSLRPTLGVNDDALLSLQFSSQEKSYELTWNKIDSALSDLIEGRVNENEIQNFLNAQLNENSKERSKRKTHTDFWFNLITNHIAYGRKINDFELLCKKPEWESRIQVRDILASLATIVKIKQPSLFCTMLPIAEDSEEEAKENEAKDANQ